MKEGAKVALPEAVSQGKTKGQDDGDFRPYEGPSKRGEKQKEGGEKNHDLDNLKKEKGRKVAVEAGIEILSEAFPNLGKAVVHPATDEGDRMTRIRPV